MPSPFFWKITYSSKKGVATLIFTPHPCPFRFVQRDTSSIIPESFIKLSSAILKLQNFGFWKSTHLEGVQKVIALAQKYAINKKSTIFVSSLWNLVKMTNSWVDYIGRISAQLDVNCGFFTNSIFLGQCNYFLYTLYISLY